jgi:hypothetical protein
VHAASNGKKDKSGKIEVRTSDLIEELLLNAGVALPDPVTMRTQASALITETVLSTLTSLMTVDTIIIGLLVCDFPRLLTA